MKSLLTTCILALTFTAPGLANDTIERAQKFLAALESGDLETVQSMAHPDIVFEDPTFGVEFAGRDVVLDVYRDYTGGSQDLRKHLVKGFETNDVVVLDYIFYVNFVGPDGDGDQTLTPVMGPGLRVIRFKDGLVIRHTDLADYSEVERQRAAAAKLR